MKKKIIIFLLIILNVYSLGFILLPNVVKMYGCVEGGGVWSWSEFECSPYQYEKELLLQEDNVIVERPSDSLEIQQLIRKVLLWANTNNGLDLLPFEHNDSIYTSVDANQLKLNLNRLTETNLFSKNFIETYRSIILTIERQFKANDFGQ